MRLSTTDCSRLAWRKSTRSGGASNDACVEVAFAGPAVAVRDSKNAATAPLAFPARDWATFLSGLAHYR